MASEHTAKLTSSEIGSLWSAYMNNTMSICVIHYFIKNTEDQDIKSVLEYALNTSKKIVSQIVEVLQKEKIYIPMGFRGEDVNADAPRLFSDYFHMYYLKHMAKIGASIYGVTLATLARSDIRDLFSEWIASSVTLYNKSANLLLSKGLFIRTPFVYISNQVDFVQKQSYLGSFFRAQDPLM